MARNQYKKRRYKKRRGPPAAAATRRLILPLKLAAAAIGIVALSATFVLGYSVLTRHQYFQAANIEVKGTVRLSRSEILEQANLENGENVLSVNLNLARRRLLSHPWVAEARVGRELPNLLTLTVREHQPSAVLEAGRRFIIDTDGTVFKEWTSRDPDHLPVVTGLTLADVPRPGASATRPFQAVMDVLSFARSPSSVLSDRAVKRIQVDRDLGCTLYTAGPVHSIRLGYGSYAAKFRRLGNILRYLKKTGGGPGIDWVDLQHHNRVVMRAAPMMSGESQGEV